MSTMQKKYEARNQNMAKDYSQRSDKLVETQQRESVKTNKENQGHLTGVRRDFNKQLRLIDLDKRRRDNGSGEFAEVMEYSGKSVPNSFLIVSTNSSTRFFELHAMNNRCPLFKLASMSARRWFSLEYTSTLLDGGL